jgi:hypothetical protein
MLEVSILQAILIGDFLDTLLESLVLLLKLIGHGLDHLYVDRHVLLLSLVELQQVLEALGPRMQSVHL